MKYKTDIISIIHGDLPFLIETKINGSLYVEGGAGLLLPYYIHDFLSYLVSDNRGVVNDRLGLSMRIHLKWYMKGNEKRYWGIHYYFRINIVRRKVR